MATELLNALNGTDPKLMHVAIQVEYGDEGLYAQIDDYPALVKLGAWLSPLILRSVGILSDTEVVVQTRSNSLLRKSAYSSLVE